MKNNKEQTLTAEERAYNFYQLSGKKDVIQLMIEFANSEVLEALERVRAELTEKTYTDGFVTSNAFEVVDKEISKQKQNQE